MLGGDLRNTFFDTKESPEELAEKMGPEPYKRPLPELPKRPLVLKEEGGHLDQWIALKSDFK